MDGGIEKCLSLWLVELLYSCCLGVSNHFLNHELFAVWRSGSDSPMILR